MGLFVVNCYRTRASFVDHGEMPEEGSTDQCAVLLPSNREVDRRKQAKDISTQRRNPDLSEVYVYDVTTTNACNPPSVDNRQVQLRREQTVDAAFRGTCIN